MSLYDPTSLKPRFMPDRDAAREWGGKGAPLVRLIRKGFAVPPTAAMGLTQMEQWLRSMPEHAPAIEAWRNGSPESRVKLAMLEQAVLDAPMPEHWVLSGATLRKFLCGDTEDEAEPWPMILRSSMSSEDAEGGSLAGCFESVVVRDTTPAGLWRGLTKVVASAFRYSSAVRILSSGVDPANFRVGVLFQPYLTAEFAGVCFSRDPSNPWDPNGAVEWVRGAGEELVQGTGDSRSRRRAEGAGNSELAPFWDTLWKRARQAEKIVGGPADIEWVWDGSQLWFVQARPIATEEARLAARAPMRRWTRALTLERFPEPMTTMGWSVLQDAFAVNLRTLDRRFGVVAKSPMDMAVCVRGTVYSDPKFFAFPSGVRIRWARYLNPFSAAPWNALVAVLRFTGRLISARGGVLSRALLRLELVQSLLGREAGLLEAGWSHHRDKNVGELRQFAPTLETLGEKASESAVLERMDALTTIGREFMEPDLAVFLIKDALNKALLAVCQGLGWDEASFADLFRSFEGNRTLEMNAEWKDCLEELAKDPGRDRFVSALEARSSRATEVLGAPARRSWEGFLDRNGHSTTSWDIALPSWGEDPAHLVPLLRAAGLGGNAKKPGIPGFSPSSNLRVEKRELLFKTLQKKYSHRAIARIRSAITQLENFMRIDEEHHFLSGLMLVPSRRLILAGGACLVRQGVLGASEEVFFLKIEELKDMMENPAKGFSLRGVVARRRSEWERAKKAVPPFELPLPRVEEILPLGGELGPYTWQGSPMSPGIVTGRAMIAEHLDQVHGIEAGAILITTSPNPALTPLYPLLGGLVSATGSALSHGFVSAREYALPAVSGISRVTEKIPNGAMVRVDGTTGRVEVLQ